MKKRSSKAVQLLLITSVLASCNKPVSKTDQEDKQLVFMRADSTAPYTNVTHQYEQQRSGSGMGSAFLWYMAFRHLGGGMGYASSDLKSQSVVGTNTAKANAYQQATRGGFGSTAKSTNARASS